MHMARVQDYASASDHKADLKLPEAASPCGQAASNLDANYEGFVRQKDAEELFTLGLVAIGIGVCASADIVARLSLSGALVRSGRALQDRPA